MSCIPRTRPLAVGPTRRRTTARSALRLFFQALDRQQLLFARRLGDPQRRASAHEKTAEEIAEGPGAAGAWLPTQHAAKAAAASPEQRAQQIHEAAS